MRKVSDTDVQIVYRQGTRSAFLFVLLIPAGIAAKVVLDADWLPVLVVTFMGIVMLFVAAMREQLVFDTLTRTITCSESIFGRQTRSELIPFGKVTRLVVGPHFERENKRKGRTRQVGFQMTIDWKAEWGGGGMMLDTFDDEAPALRAAEELGRRIGTSVERTRR